EERVEHEPDARAIRGHLVGLLHDELSGREGADPVDAADVVSRAVLLELEGALRREAPRGPRDPRAVAASEERDALVDGADARDHGDVRAGDLEAARTAEAERVLEPHEERLGVVLAAKRGADVALEH